MTTYLFKLNIHHYLNTFQTKTDKYCMEVKRGMFGGETHEQYLFG